MLVLQLEVVPVLAAHEHATVAVFQLQVMDTLEDLREGLALLEVDPAVVGGTRGRLALAVRRATDDAVAERRVEVADEIRIRRAQRPAGAHGQRRIELPFDLPDVEVDGMSLCSYAHSNGSGQQLRPEDSAHCSNCHAALQLRMWWRPHANQAFHPPITA
ncbi:hypothetical protein D9M68_669660 [compost metagenome]